MKTKCHRIVSEDSQNQKWRTLRSQMNVIINPNSQQHAEMEFEMLHTRDGRYGLKNISRYFWHLLR